MPAPVIVGILSIVGMTLVGSLALGLWWDIKRWPIVALIHYAIFVVL